jgi:hypothetical protein
MKISENPLEKAGVKPMKNPIWVCKHESAVIIDYENKKYICPVCLPGKVIRKYSQDELLSTITNAEHIKKSS